MARRFVAPVQDISRRNHSYRFTQPWLLDMPQPYPPPYPLYAGIDWETVHLRSDALNRLDFRGIPQGEILPNSPPGKDIELD